MRAPVLYTSHFRARRAPGRKSSPAPAMTISPSTKTVLDLRAHPGGSAARTTVQKARHICARVKTLESACYGNLLLKPSDRSHAFAGVE